MTQNLRLLDLLETVLGQSKKTAKGNHSFFCPFPNCKKHARKLEINLTPKNSGEHKWHCWVCDRKGTYIHQLLKKLRAPQSRIDDANTLIGNVPPQFTNPDDAIVESVHLPEEYRPLWEHSESFEYKRALNYVLKVRGITPEDVFKYKIGYCPRGIYGGKIIIPSYDAYGNLNYFTGRAYKQSKLNHKNPDVSKDVIGFELFVNWGLPIVLVEGALDAISIRRNVIPLFGKIVLDELRKRIIEENVKDIYIALDKDALKKAMKEAQIFLNEGINVYFVDMSDKDPNKIGFEGMNRIIRDTQPLSLSNLIKMKINM